MDVKEADVPGQIVVVDERGEMTISLRSSSGLAKFWEQANTPCYLDITGLTHPTWAALLRGALLARVDLRVVYESRFDIASIEFALRGNCLISL